MLIINYVFDLNRLILLQKAEMPRRQNLRKIPKDMPRKQKVPMRLEEVKQSYLIRNPPRYTKRLTILPKMGRPQKGCSVTQKRQMHHLVVSELALI